MLFSLVILAFIFVTGLVIGSFLNVVILRTVSEESIIFPASKCPHCQNALKWYHNIPVLSYIYLRGKCAYCKEHISWQYPCVELLTGIIFIGLFLRFCTPFDEFLGLYVMNAISLFQVINYIFALIVSCLFIVIAGTDFIEMKVSELHLYSLIGVGVVYSVIMAILNLVYYSKEFGMPTIDINFFLTCPVLYSMAAAIIGFIFMEILRRFTGYLLKTDTFGDGDSYIAAGIGAVVGGLFGNFTPYQSFLQILYILAAILILSAIIPAIYTLPRFIKKLYIDKNWLTLGALSTFVIYAAAYGYAINNAWLENMPALICATVVMCILAIFTCKEILCGIKNGTSDGNPMPFGPSLVISAFVAIAFLPLV